MEENKCCPNGDCEKCKTGICCGNMCCNKSVISKIIILIILVVIVFLLGTMVAGKGNFRKDLKRNGAMNEIGSTVESPNSASGSITVNVVSPEELKEIQNNPPVLE